MSRRHPTTTNGGRKRTQRGTGRLYKRAGGGKEYPADDPVNAPYWLAYVIPNPAGGRGQCVRVALHDADGKPITTRAEAEAERKRIVAPYLTGSNVETLKALQARLADAQQTHAAAVEVANPPLRIADAWTAYTAASERPDSGDLTLTRYAGHWERFAAWLASKQPAAVYLRDVTAETAAAYAGDLVRAGYGPNTYNKHVGFLRLLFRVLADQARTAGNPFAKVTRKNLRTHSRRELTVAELSTVLDRADGDLATLLFLGACTGLRLGDCCTLSWGEVDIARRLIRRVPNKTARKGKPVLLGIPPVLLSRLSASRTRARTGYVLPDLAERYRRDVGLVTNTVKAHLLDCGIDVHAPGTGERIIRQPDATPERDPNTGRVLTRDTGRPAVVEVGFHSLRHTWVSMHAAHGTPQAIVQASVGHASPAMTAHYTHVTEATARDVALALPVFSGETAPAREPLPAWAREIVRNMTADTWQTGRAELLAEVIP